MRKGIQTLRRAAVVAVAAASILGAMFLIWNLVTREQVVRLSTLQLLAMLALFLLPGATYAAWELDRRTLREKVGEPAGDSGDDELFEMPEGIELAEEPAAPTSDHARFEEPTPEAEQPPAPGITAGTERLRQVHTPHRRRLSAGRGVGKRL